MPWWASGGAQPADEADFGRTSLRRRCFRSGYWPYQVASDQQVMNLHIHIKNTTGLPAMPSGIVAERGTITRPASSVARPCTVRHRWRWLTCPGVFRGTGRELRDGGLEPATTSPRYTPRRIGNPTHPERPGWPETGRSRGRDGPSTRSGGAGGRRERCRRGRSWLLGRASAGQRAAGRRGWRRHRWQKMAVTRRRADQTRRRARAGRGGPSPASTRDHRPNRVVRGPGQSAEVRCARRDVRGSAAPGQPRSRKRRCACPRRSWGR